MADLAKNLAVFDIPQLYGCAYYEPVKDRLPVVSGLAGVMHSLDPGVSPRYYV